MSSETSQDFPELEPQPEDPKEPTAGAGEEETDPTDNPDGYMGGADIKK